MHARQTMHARKHTISNAGTCQLPCLLSTLATPVACAAARTTSQAELWTLRNAKHLHPVLKGWLFKRMMHANCDLLLGFARAFARVLERRTLRRRGFVASVVARRLCDAFALLLPESLQAEP